MFVDRDVKVGFDAADEFSNCHNGEVLDWSLKITGTDDGTTRREKTAVLTRRHKSKKPSTERIIHTNVLNRSKRRQSGRELRHETILLECLHLNDT